jgi:hypothetical protein
MTLTPFFQRKQNILSSLLESCGELRITMSFPEDIMMSLGLSIHKSTLVAHKP